MANSGSILFLAPQLYDSQGGIQAYMRRLLEVLSAYSRDRGYLLHCISLGDGQWAEERHPRPVEPEVFLACHGSKPRFALGALKLAWRRRPDLTVVGHIGLAPLAWALRRLGLAQRYILLLHGIEAWKKVAWLDRRAASAAACIVTFSRYTAREFCRHNNVPSDRIRLIPLALAEEEIAPPFIRHRSAPGLNVLTVARLSVDDRFKGIDTVVRAVARAQSRGADIHLTVVGDGNDRPRLETVASRLNLDGQVAFAGAVADERLRDLYQQCDVFAMPSRKEGFGIVFLEAMRFGKPCIGGNHGGTPEIITAGVDGYLVDHGDEEQLAACFVNLAERPEMGRAVGLRGYHKVAAGYLFPHMRSNWFSVLDAVAGRC